MNFNPQSSKMKTAEFAHSVDPNKAPHNKLAHLDLPVCPLGSL